MTETQRHRVLGWNISLSQRGVPVSLPNASQVTVLIEKQFPDGGEYTLSDLTRNAVTLHVLREHLNGATVGVGECITNPATGASYRVTDIDDNPDDIIVRWTCELNQ